MSVFFSLLCTDGSGTQWEQPPVWGERGVFAGNGFHVNNLGVISMDDIMLSGMSLSDLTIGGSGNPQFLLVFSGGTVSDVLIENGGDAEVWGIARDVTLNGDGELNVQRGGLADGVSFTMHTETHVTPGGMHYTENEYRGELNVLNGGRAVRVGPNDGVRNIWVETGGEISYTE